MTDHRDLLTDAFGRLHECVHAALEDLTDDDLVVEVEPEANTVAWLVWHLSRILDDHIARAAGREQVWHTTWARRFDLPLDDDDLGYANTVEEMRSVRVGRDLLLGYHHAAYDAAVRFVAGVTAEDLDRVVDRDFDPPVTLAVRLVSVVNDTLQHVGQAAYARGILLRRTD